MHTTKIVNPKTNRTVTVRYWDIDRDAVIDSIRNKTWDTKGFSWDLLSDKQTYQTMVNEEYGDSASNNFALSIFEHALDWRLGLAVINTIQIFAKAHKKPKNFKLAVARNGDVFIILASGTVWVML